MPPVLAMVPPEATVAVLFESTVTAVPPVAKVIVPPFATVTLPAVAVLSGAVVLELTVVSAKAATGKRSARAEAEATDDRMVVLRRRSINPS